MQILTHKYTLMALAGIIGLYWYRHHNQTGVSGVTATEEATNAAEAGSDFLPNLWGMFNGQGTSNTNFPNPVPGSNANPGGNGPALLGLTPSWDGSMTNG